MRVLSFILLWLTVAATATANAANIGRCGGSGPKSTTLSCPSGSYIVGIWARGAAYVDRIGIACAGFDSAGHRGSIGSWKTAGGTGGSDTNSDICDGDRALASLFSNSGIYLDRVLDGNCARRASGDGFQVQNSFAPSERVRVNIGGIGGSFCRLICPQGEALHQIVVRYGSWIDGVEGYCRR